MNFIHPILRLLGAVVFTAIFALFVGIKNIESSLLLLAFIATIFVSRLAEVFSPAADTLKKYKKDEDQSRWTTFAIAFSFFTNAILPMLEYRHGLVNLANFFVPRWGFQEHQVAGADWWNWLGLLFLIAGSALRIRAIHRAGASFLPHVKADAKLKLITDGPYGFVRHPSYLGTLGSYLGIAMIFDSIIGAVSLVALVIPTLILRIKKEEQLLASRFGEGWKKYQTQTPSRLIPGVW
jgi:protein-S-isoprenylcysteine O-methyltransferase Ste14